MSSPPPEGFLAPIVGFTNKYRNEERGNVCERNTKQFVHPPFLALIKTKELNKRIK
jgi:hypothetical protein